MDLKRIIRLGGVPEHFNYPWKLWLNDVDSNFEDCAWEWTDFPGGSGAMIQALESGETDVAFVLTEAVANAKMKGSNIVPLAVFVESPLIWGIFTSSKNELTQISPVENKKYAISRRGSGSELMAKVDSLIRVETIPEDNFIVVQNLEGARFSLASGETDLFMWEKWMTKPLVDAGEFKMIDERPTPWPCFLMVCTPEFYQDKKALETLNLAYMQVLRFADSFKRDGASAEILNVEYKIQVGDAKTWLNHVKWAQNWIQPEESLQQASEIIARI